MGVSLDTDREVEAIASALGTLVQNIKGKKTGFSDYEPVIQPLFLAVGAMPNLINDLKKVDNQVLLVKAVLDAVEATALVAKFQAKMQARKSAKPGHMPEKAHLSKLEAEQEVKLPPPQ